jgi:hypothetical protein
VLLLVGHAGAKPLIAGQGTADWLLRQAGARNLADHQGYKNFSVEALAALDPDVVVFSDRALAGEAALQALIKENPALAGSRAVRDKRLLSLDPTLLVGGLGPRCPLPCMSWPPASTRPPRPASPHEAAGPATHAVHWPCAVVPAGGLAVAGAGAGQPAAVRYPARRLAPDRRADQRCGARAGRNDPRPDPPAAYLAGAGGGRGAGAVGVAMQGLFRNPLADPGLVGAAGAAMGAAVAIVAALVWRHAEWFAPYLLSLCAFIGGLGVTALVYRLGRRDGQTNVATMLLAGIAMTALGARPSGCSPTWPMTRPCAP